MRRSLPLLLLALLPSSAPAQLSEIEVTVRATASRQPLAGAQVRVDDLGVGGVTDQDGVLRLRRIVPGVRTVEVRLLGYSSASAAVRVAPGSTAVREFELLPSPIALAPVRAGARPGALARNGFFRRADRGVGSFLTRAEISEIRPRTMGDLLRHLPGLSVTTGRLGSSVRSRGADHGCPIQYYLDGVPAPAFNVDGIAPEDVEGLEIYRGAASIPPEFNRGTALCGVILIWTRVE